MPCADCRVLILLFHASESRKAVVRVLPKQIWRLYEIAERVTVRTERTPDCVLPSGRGQRVPRPSGNGTLRPGAVQGGAAGIRANSPEDIRAIRQAVSVPIIGIWKAEQDDGKISITPSLEAAQQVVEAGACLVALDRTRRGQRYGALERVRRIKDELGVPVLADIAMLNEAVQAAKAGADAVPSTMRGYTEETCQALAFEPPFVAELAGAQIVFKFPLILPRAVSRRSSLMPSAKQFVTSHN